MSQFERKNYFDKAEECVIIILEYRYGAMAVDSKIDEKSVIPKYYQLATILKGVIQKGRLNPGDCLPSAQKLMKEYKLSLWTVRRATQFLENEGIISSRRGSGTFVLPQARNKTKGRLLVVECNMKVMTEYESRLLKAIEHSAKRIGVPIAFCSINDEEENGAIVSYLKSAKGEEDCGGMILTGIITLKSAVLAQKMGARCILTSDLCQEEPTCGRFEVITTSPESTYLTAAYLVSLGHSKIAYVGREPRYSWELRLLGGYKKALDEGGVRYDSGLVKLTTGRILQEEYVEWGKKLAKELLTSSSPTAIVCGGDHYAVGVLWTAQRLGIDVPEELSICGGGNYSIGRDIYPSLTSTDRKLEEVGRMAVEYLVSEKRIPGNRKETLPALIIRGSTAPLSDSKTRKVRRVDAAAIQD